ncbi:hypothetical protein MPTK1_5g14330 [Marchantia polymorpha subsp. ruderalis]|uniref:Uncharacterized protein n=2 Tax=Marchantia polymorpha TaxID=3197 RepID=A0AAF6BIA3_MARPO|nr:hypothetical protein MARPO_0032s0125 [Marchantia polymorpha]BBN11737.1 hypothetical protein Mp_5g14330 [Marchantia polymorpha subsp. ruderalis]|eukprot:PTQ41954.1 hypothetical protein MARPO_0032s0125 [Marchantia polymorpha]
MRRRCCIPRVKIRHSRTSKPGLSQLSDYKLQRRDRHRRQPNAYRPSQIHVRTKAQERERRGETSLEPVDLSRGLAAIMDVAVDQRNIKSPRHHARTRTAVSELGLATVRSGLAVNRLTQVQSAISRHLPFLAQSTATRTCHSTSNPCYTSRQSVASVQERRERPDHFQIAESSPAPSGAPLDRRPLKATMYGMRNKACC